MSPQVAGLLLAAGAGLRAGGPKALRTDADGTSWLVRAAQVLQQGGCGAVTVVLGSGSEQARRILDQASWPAGNPAVVEAVDWAEGMSASLRTGLLVVADTDVQVVVVHLVDLPDVTDHVVRRLLDQLDGPDTLARAVYGGRPGHPVLIGRNHLRAIASEVAGDQGARGYLDRQHAYGVECGDLATGGDQDS